MKIDWYSVKRSKFMATWLLIVDQSFSIITKAGKVKLVAYVVYDTVKFPVETTGVAQGHIYKPITRGKAQLFCYVRNETSQFWFFFKF